MIRDTGKEYSGGEMVELIVDSGLMESNMEEGSLRVLMGPRSSWESGIME
jgi:hypothetical protein